MSVFSAAGLRTDGTEEMYIETKKMKRDFEEKLLDAGGDAGGGEAAGDWRSRSW